MQSRIWLEAVKLRRDECEQKRLELTAANRAS
jgi:hypothetical protein